MFSLEEKNKFLHGDAMRGFGYDIANSYKLTDNEKSKLIKAVEDWLFRDIPFSTTEKNLLWKVRKEYHINNSVLTHIAEPASWYDRIFL